MTLKYFQNYLDSLSRTPNQQYLDDAQAFYDNVWENSTQTAFEVLQQDSIGSTEYHKEDISVDMMIDLMTGEKRADDWKVFSYRNMNADTKLGLMYQFSNNYWLATNTDDYGSPTHSIEVRRCNNHLRWLDTKNGAIYDIPCVVDYAVQSPQALKDKDVIVSNGHIVVYVQGNELTHSLRKNQRFLFNRQAFKLISYNNYLQNDMVTPDTTILYFDFYLDTIHPEDSLDLNVADYGKYRYNITLQNTVSQQVKGFAGKVYPTVTLNNDTVERDVVYTANEYVTVKDDGSYVLTGDTGKRAIITAYLMGNPEIFATSEIEIVDNASDISVIVISSEVNDVYEGQPETFEVNLYKNGIKQDDIVEYTTNNVDKSKYAISREKNKFAIKSFGYCSEKLNITFSVANLTKQINVNLKPLF